MTAEYETPNNELNQVNNSHKTFNSIITYVVVFFVQVILWDKIILRGENANLRLKNMRTKYYFWDDGNGLRYANIFDSLQENIYIYFCF